jgi:hypothetical protein
MSELKSCLSDEMMSFVSDDLPDADIPNPDDICLSEQDAKYSELVSLVRMHDIFTNPPSLNLPVAVR